MRPILLVKVDKLRPALMLTRPVAVDRMNKVTVAPITTRIRELGSEVRVGPSNGLDSESVVSCDNIQVVPTSALGRVIGYLHEEQEADLIRAVVHAFDLRAEDLP